MTLAELKLLFLQKERKKTICVDETYKYKELSREVRVWSGQISTNASVSLYTKTTIILAEF